MIKTIYYTIFLSNIYFELQTIKFHKMEFKKKKIIEKPLLIRSASND